MDTALKAAVEEALKSIKIRFDETPSDVALAERIEYLRLREFRTMGLMRPLAARLALLATLGWKRTTIAEALDVSRVTLNNWLRDHTAGADTFKPYGPDALEGDPDSAVTDQVTAPLINKLTARNAEMLGQVRYEHDKFIVPSGFVRPLSALWRVAYKSRGPEHTNDPDIAAAGDALDIMISMLLRRGVTNLAIAKAAGVTHRAVLDRMNRARGRGLILVCNGDDCESFYGEEVLRRKYVREEQILLGCDEWLQSDQVDGITRLVSIRITSPRPSRYWLQTLVDTSKDEHPAAIMPVRGAAHVDWHTRLHAALHPCSDDSGARVAYDELFAAALLGRMNEASFDSNTLAKRFRTGTMYVPANLLYTEAMERAGALPKTPAEATTHIPDGLWARYFGPFPTVVKCFTDPSEIEDEFDPTVKHKADAKTRRGAA